MGSRIAVSGLSMKRIVLQTLLGIGFLTPGLWAASLSLPTYSFYQCGGAGLPACNVTQAYTAPTTTQLAGLNGEAFVKYAVTIGLAGPGVTDPSVYHWTITGANANGVILGLFGGPASVENISFLFYQGQVLCCSTDSPFALLGINNSNIVIGGQGTPDGSPVIGFAPLTAPVKGIESIRVNLTGRLTNPLDEDFGVYTAIDNAGDLLLKGGSGNQYVLTPVPEPSSMALLGTSFLVAGCLYRRSKAKSVTPNEQCKR